MERFEQSFKRMLFALSNNLDAPIGEVTHKTFEIVSARSARGEIAKHHKLYPAAYDCA